MDFFFFMSIIAFEKYAISCLFVCLFFKYMAGISMVVIIFPLCYQLETQCQVQMSQNEECLIYIFNY